VLVFGAIDLLFSWLYVNAKKYDLLNSFFLVSFFGKEENTTHSEKPAA
jgi:hypothetical protein